MPEGVQDPNIIDKVVQEKDGSVRLVMREDRPWQPSEQRFAELNKKIDAYAAYVRSGQLVKDFPQTAERPVTFQLWCIQHRPDSKLMEFLDQVNARLAQNSLQIRLLVIEVVTPEMQREQRRREGKPWWKIW